jgi:hypothetical protein
LDCGGRATDKKRSTDQQTDMQLWGQKKRKNRESEKTKSVDEETKKIDRSTGRHATDLIFGDTLISDKMLVWQRCHCMGLAKRQGRIQ